MSVIIIHTDKYTQREYRSYMSMEGKWAKFSLIRRSTQRLLAFPFNLNSQKMMFNLVELLLVCSSVQRCSLKSYYCNMFLFLV